jgi:hypothetical protein
MPEEMKQIGFDEAALLKELGMNYVHIPMRGSAENPYGPKQLDQFAAAIASADGQGVVALHGGMARQPHLGGVPDSRSRRAGRTRRSRRRAASICETRRRSADSSRSKDFSERRFPSSPNRSKR